ncbi:hypothetical protein SAMN04487818_10928 [Actinokineospora terrae]|uniref:Uncharacterized protein n=1 Tax=Actinokineospora terrae TaxID=155974 RepID=A0A1H9VS29_9PSEU|nr:hypothetical protein SAMN04487818_10928 [Actinokineospora terrae]
MMADRTPPQVFLGDNDAANPKRRPTDRRWVSTADRGPAADSRLAVHQRAMARPKMAVDHPDTKGHELQRRRQPTRRPRTNESWFDAAGRELPANSRPAVLRQAVVCPKTAEGHPDTERRELRRRWQPPRRPRAGGGWGGATGRAPAASGQLVVHQQVVVGPEMAKDHPDTKRRELQRRRQPPRRPRTISGQVGAADREPPANSRPATCRQVVVRPKTATNHPDTKGHELQRRRQPAKRPRTISGWVGAAGRGAAANSRPAVCGQVVVSPEAAVDHPGAQGWEFLWRWQSARCPWAGRCRLAAEGRALAQQCWSVVKQRVTRSRGLPTSRRNERDRGVTACRQAEENSRMAAGHRAGQNTDMTASHRAEKNTGVAVSHRTEKNSRMAAGHRAGQNTDMALSRSAGQNTGIAVSGQAEKNTGVAVSGRGGKGRGVVVGHPVAVSGAVGMGGHGWWPRRGEACLGAVVRRGVGVWW